MARAAKPQKGKTEKTESSNGIKKQYLKSGICKVTFKLPVDAAHGAKTVTIVGDFNEWNKALTPCKKEKNGDFTVTLDLKSGHEYRFRYLIDGTKWENDWHADKYSPNPHGTEDSIVVV